MQPQSQLKSEWGGRLVVGTVSSSNCVHCFRCVPVGSSGAGTSCRSNGMVDKLMKEAFQLPSSGSAFGRFAASAPAGRGTSPYCMSGQPL